MRRETFNLDDSKATQCDDIAAKILKENYRPASITSYMLKVFERLVYRQIGNYMNDKLSPFLTDFRKNHNTQHFLSTMLEKWRNKLNKGKFIGVMFMNLSKAFDSINHN